MFQLLKKLIQKLSNKTARHEKSRINTENERMAMSCGAFNPRFLAMVKRTKYSNC